jgi:hypothetical protein
MRRPFWLIDGKLREADFFLEKLRAAPDLDDARYYFSAFASAARSITYAIQVCLRGVPGFERWYESKQEKLKRDSIAKYFHCLRNHMNHVGLNPLGRMTRGILTTEFFLVGKNVPEENAVVACRGYLSALVGIAAEAFEKFWHHLDLPADITIATLEERGFTLEDVEAEFGLPARWSAGAHRLPAKRLELLKEYSKTVIGDLREKYPAPPS